MIKKSEYGSIGGGIVVVGVMVMIVAMLFDAKFEINLRDAPIAEPPPAVRVYMPMDCVVDVSNWMVDGQRSYGRGVVVNYGGETFVLTSSMIFTHGGEIMINRDVDSNSRVAYAAEIIHRSDDWGLVALDCSLEGAPAIEINEFPNHPPNGRVLVGEHTVNTLEYLNDNWVLLDGGLPPEATGMPTENAGGLVGIIVGLNRANQEQAIMVGNRAIREFVDQLTYIEAPLPLRAEQ